jgi:hypothetical protein
VHLLPSQIAAVNQAVLDAGLSNSDFEWDSEEGSWAGVSAYTPILRHVTQGWTCAFAEAPQWTSGGRMVHRGRLLHTIQISPSENRRSDLFQRASWDGVMEIVRSWLGYVRREHGLPSLMKPASDANLAQGELSSRQGAVFVIHGRDATNTDRLRRLLIERFRLEPVILGEQAGGGRTLIEKFEDVAARCAFSIALLTPDDAVARGETAYLQARPNVVFELGWFYGKRGRQSVLILLRHGAHLHSDLDGISRVEFGESIEERVLDIERELHAAGLLAHAAG